MTVCTTIIVMEYHHSPQMRAAVYEAGMYLYGAVVRVRNPTKKVMLISKEHHLNWLKYHHKCYKPEQSLQDKIYEPQVEFATGREDI